MDTMSTHRRFSTLRITLAATAIAIVAGVGLSWLTQPEPIDCGETQGNAYALFEQGSQAALSDSLREKGVDPSFVTNLVEASWKIDTSISPGFGWCLEEGNKRIGEIGGEKMKG